MLAFVVDFKVLEETVHISVRKGLIGPTFSLLLRMIK